MSTRSRVVIAGVPHAIATRGYQETALRSMQMLDISLDTPLVTRDQVVRAKPDPRPLPRRRRARALGVGLLSGGYGEQELERAGAYRVYQDPADLLAHLDEVGVR